MGVDIDGFLKFIKAEAKAFEKAGIKTGEVTFTCPICGGKAIGVRYEHGGRIHGLGSRCTQCGIKFYAPPLATVEKYAKEGR